MSEKFDTHRQESIVCPHCGHVHRDSWDLQADSGKYECENENCEKTFFCEREIEVSYSTTKLKD